MYDTVYINVTLLDQNDETPTFDQEDYVFEIAENSKGDIVNITKVSKMMPVIMYCMSL